jgi:fumarate hydratase, class II
MICLQVIANDTAVGVAGSQGNFELNAMRPIIIKNVLHSSQILGDACDTLHKHSIDGIALDKKRIEKYVSESLMLVTALTSVIGYDKASSIAHNAFQENCHNEKRRFLQDMSVREISTELLYQQS